MSFLFIVFAEFQYRDLNILCPFGNKYRPQFYLRTMDCTGEITLPAGVEMVMPGDNVEITVELIYAVALNQGLRFAIREGGRTVGSGQITEVFED